MLVAILLFLVTTLGAALLTGLVRRHATRAGIMDHPNERSSHQLPTPRGGGLAVSACLLGAVLALFAVDLLRWQLAAALGAGGTIVTLIGWIDDRRGLPVPWRAAAYLVTSVAAVALLGGLPTIAVGSLDVRIGIAGSVIAACALAWLINLYNFMDGTDALAATQAITAAGVAGLLFVIGGNAAAAWICLILVAACAGFLYWNWPPAKIFLGDSGSCLLGFYFGVLAIVGENSGAVPLAAWLILLSIFVCDATLTLLRRVMAREKWYSPHRSHAYQLLVQAGMSHRDLVLCVLATNIFLSGPLAVFAVLNRAYLLPAAAAALGLVSLLWAAVQFRLLPQFPPQ